MHGASAYWSWSRREVMFIGFGDLRRFREVWPGGLALVNFECVPL